MNNDIKVSVLMLAYNHGKYIRQALDSVFMQKTNFKFEVIVGEDCSPYPDKSREILLEYKEKYGDQLVLVLHEKNVGATKNGMSIRRLAKGKYTAGLECDDYWTDEYKLQKQYDFLESHPKFSACGANNCLVNEDGKKVIEDNLLFKKDKIFTLKQYKNNGYNTVHGNSLLKRKDITPIDNPKYQELRSCAPTMGDIILYSLLYNFGPIYVFKDVMVAHREGSKDKSSYSYQQRKTMVSYSYMQMDIAKALNKYFDYKKDFSFIIVNRLAEVTFAYLFFKKSYNIDKKELKKLYKENPLTIRIRAFFALIKQTVSRGHIKLIRIIKNKFSNK